MLVTAFWFVLIGALLVALALMARFIDRLPVSPAMIYLVVGFLLGPTCFNLLELHPQRISGPLELISLGALLIALFTVGIKMRVPLTERAGGDWRWSVPVRLATFSMLVTIALVALAAWWLFDFPPALALVVAAVLAPTDPVLASDVQLRSAEDRDALRFGLTGEGGLNDGTAYPFVLLGLGLMGLHELGEYGWRWIAVDLVWGVAGGLAIGFGVGDLVARGVRHLRAWRSDAGLLDEFLLLGVIALSYGIAHACATLGFLAVFAAGIALRRADDERADVRHADKQPLTPSLLKMNEQLERLVEVAIVLLVGAIISTGYWSVKGLALAALLFIVIRPIAVYLGLIGVRQPERPVLTMFGAWFGIRGIGSVYYAIFVLGFGLAYSDSVELLAAVFTVIASSIVVHGISATPLMALHRGISRRRRAGPRVSDKR
jgi:sodium/hydrogen antiporter